MKWYPWLTPYYNKMVSLHQNKQGHHSILIHSAVELGAELLVNATARWLMCQNTDGEKVCGTCRSCLLMIAGNHPDWYILIPENGKQIIGIEQVRKTIQQLYIRAKQDGRKIIWLPSVELLTEAAANALLKTLEEPPEGTYFILSCTEPQRILPTIRSRCLFWSIALPNENYNRQWLCHQGRKESDDIINSALRLNQNSAINALNYLATEKWQEKNKLYQLYYESFQNQDAMPMIAEINRVDCTTLLYWLSVLCLDAIKWQQRATEYMTNQDQLDLIIRYATKFSSNEIRIHHKLFIQSIQQLNEIAGINKELILTNLFCKLV